MKYFVAIPRTAQEEKGGDFEYFCLKNLTLHANQSFEEVLCLVRHRTVYLTSWALVFVFIR